MSERKDSKTVLLGKTLQEMIALTQRASFEGYRGKQLFGWIYRNQVLDFARMNNLPENFREFLTEHYIVTNVRLENTETDSEGTSKLLFALGGGEYIEGVLMKERKRWTLCVSIQVGCALNCAFCLTGKEGFTRNLETDEILAQLLLSLTLLKDDEQIGNVVLMGMGEPLLNTDNVVRALRFLTSPQAFAVSNRRVTVSTAGIVPGIRRLGEEDLGINLALSLNATTDTLRNELMPINKKYPIPMLLDVVKEFPLTKRRRITFEYVLLKGINDSVRDATRLIKLLHGLRCKVNLIMFNPDPSIPFEPTEPEILAAFRETLSAAHLTVAVRYSKGAEIHAACGQLAAHLKS